MQRIKPPLGRYGRRPHVIAPLKRSAGATRVVCVDVETWEEQLEPGVTRSHLLRWSAVACRVGTGLPGAANIAEGIAANQFWRWLAAHLPDRTRTWLVAYRAVRTAALLDLWEMMANGKASIARRLHGNKDTGDVGISVLQGAGVRDQGSGGMPSVQSQAPPPPVSLCIADPPTSIGFKLAAAKGSVLLLDWRNWGHEYRDISALWPNNVIAMADWLCKASLVLKTCRLGGLRATPGSQAMATWRVGAYTHPVHIHTYADAIKLERQSYRGGRVEAMRLGKIWGPIYQLDIRSSYASSMLTASVPTVLESYSDECDLNPLFDQGMWPVSIADVTLDTLTADYPTLAVLSPGKSPWPLSHAVAGREACGPSSVVYPVGRFRAVLSGPELVYAAARRAIVRVHRIATYRCAPALSRFAELWLSILNDARIQQDRLIANWAKRVVVGLDGKLGERGKVWVDCEPDGQWGDYAQWYQVTSDGRKVCHRVFAGCHQASEVGDESYTSVPSIAGWITSAARVRLLNLMELAGRQNVYYVDTDGILCNEQGYKRLSEAGEIRESEPGYLRLQGIHADAEIMGLRHFRVGGKLQCSGLPVGADLADDGSGSWWHKPTAVQSMMEQRPPDAEQRRHGAVRVRPYLHGVVGPDGSVTPHQVEW